MIKNINTKFLILFILIVVSFLLRLISSYFYGDTKWEGEPTEWGILVHHLTNYNSYSLYRFGDLLAPSVYMPPGYPMLLYLLKIISFGAVNFIKLVIFFQIILSTYSVYIFYQLNLNLFSEKLSLINASIFSIFPLNIYLPSQVSSITLQFFLSLLFLQFLLLIIKKQIPKNIIFFSLISGLLILTRGEFVIVFFAIILFSLFYKNIKLINLLKIILIVSLVISPM